MIEEALIEHTGRSPLTLTFTNLSPRNYTERTPPSSTDESIASPHAEFLLLLLETHEIGEDIMELLVSNRNNTCLRYRYTAVDPCDASALHTNQAPFTPNPPPHTHPYQAEAGVRIVQRAAQVRDPIRVPRTTTP